MQLKSQNVVNSLLILAVFLLSFSLNSLQAENSSESLNLTSKSNTNPSEATKLPAKMLYPDYFRKTEEISWENIKDALNFKLAFLRGRRPVKEYVKCYRFQKRITKFVGKAIKDEEIKIKDINNDFLFNDGSGIEVVFSTLPVSPSSSCNFHSFGDLKKNCIFYCEYHGLDIDNDFFKAHQKEIDASKPFISADDIAEFILFSPVLLMLIIIYFLLPRKKEPIQETTKEAQYKKNY